MSKQLKIGLFGFGCVGQGLYDIIEKTKFQAEIAQICVKNRNKKRSIPMDYFTYDKNELLNNPAINVIVELIDDAAEAFQIVKKALESGKDVVTANKKMVAEHLEELVHLQQENNCALLYEASVCGSIPIIRTLAEYYDNELLFSVSGIFNGSSNFILSKVIQENLSYNQALKQAQDLGFAETDPTLDVGGFDPMYKACIVTTHAYGVFIDPKEVFNYGIQSLSDYDIRFAQEKGYKLKLLATVVRNNDEEMALHIMPHFIPEQHYLYYVEQEYNGVIVEAAFSDKQVFVGKGAGGHPTGSAVLSDISALRYDYKYAYKKYINGQPLRYNRSIHMEIYMRYHSEEELLLIDFEEISEKYQGVDFNYVIGIVNLDQLFHKKDILEDNQIFIANTGREVTEAKLKLVEVNTNKA